MASRSTSSEATSRRVVGYVRISKDRDNETSTETQAAAIRAFCEARGWTLVHTIVEPGRSAFKASRRSRPGFREAMQLVANGAADAFVVWKIDRAARNVLDLLSFVEDLEGHHAEFASVTEQFDTTTPMGQAMLSIIATLAQLESAQKSERATEWHRHRRVNAIVPAGPAPLGYSKPEPNRLELDPATAPLVRAAAASVIAGGSVNGAMKNLNAAGVKISNPGLRATFQSPTIAGLVAVTNGPLPRRGGARIVTDDVELVPGPWEPLIDRETWDELRSLLNDPNRRTHDGNRLKWPLVPIVRCSCGSKMRHHVEKWAKKNGTGTMGRFRCLECPNGIGYDVVEEAVTEAVLDHLSPDVWARIRAASRTAAPPPDTAEMEAKLARMWEMVLDGTIEPEEYAAAKTRWRGEIAAAAAPQTFELPDVDDVRAAWPDLLPADRLLIFRAAIRRFVINPATRRGGRGVDLHRVDLELV